MKLALLAAALCALPQGWSTRRLPSGRVYRLYVPPGAPDPLPLVLEFHGRGSRAVQQRLLSRFDDAADAGRFLLVEPEGLNGQWNAGPCCGEADDLGFVRALLDALDCVDRKHVHAAGMSNGGLFAQRLACEMPGRFASVASVAGAAPFQDCSASVPVLLIHGTEDPVLSFSGALRGAQGWAARNRCGPGRREVLRRGDATCEAREGCAAELQFCSIEAGGHTWPGGPPLTGLGKTSRDLDATAIIAAFFARH